MAGDAIEIIRLGTFAKPTFFVEDSAQVTVMEEIARAVGADVLVTECGNKANVRSLYRLSRNDGGWISSTFVEDGDNEGSPFSDPHFIHLEKYCIESYLLDPATAAVAMGRTEGEIRQAIFRAITDNRDRIFQKNKFFEFLIAHFTIEHITEENIGKLDASVVMKSFLQIVGSSEADYIRQYVQTSYSRGSLRSVLPTAVVDAMRQATVRAG